MSNYVTYQCNLCRRKKDFIRDDSRVMTNNCTITKGCLGSLSKIGDTTVYTATAADPQLTDWYARGTSITPSSTVKADPGVSLSSSSTGVLTLAIKQNEAFVLANPNINLKFIQRKVNDISYTLYQYKMTEVTDIVSGRDLNNKILRFNQLAIDEDRISVRVNGILKFAGIDFSLSVDTITLSAPLSIDSTVEVSVYTAKDVISRNLSFTSNNSTAVSINSGAWGNVRWVMDNDGNKWWVYSSSDGVSLPTSTRLQLDGIFNATDVEIITDYADTIFLYTAPPYKNVDRYANLYTSGLDLKDDFYVLTTKDVINQLYVDKPFVKEIFPPFKFIISSPATSSSFVSPDILDTSGTITSDLDSKITSTKIIGPI